MVGLGPIDKRQTVHNQDDQSVVALAKSIDHPCASTFRGPRTIMCHRGNLLMDMQSRNGCTNIGQRHHFKYWSTMMTVVRETGY